MNEWILISLVWGILGGASLGTLLAMWDLKRQLGPYEPSAKEQREYDRQRRVKPSSPSQVLTNKTLAIEGTEQ